MLSFDSERRCLVFTQGAMGPNPVEQLEAKVATQCLFDDFALTLAGSSGAHLYRSQHFLVDR